MTDIQILTLIIGITFPVLALAGTIAALMYSNKRLDDLGSAINKRLEDFEKRIDEKLDNGFDHLELLLKLHEAEHHK